MNLTAERGIQLMLSAAKRERRRMYAELRRALGLNRRTRYRELQRRGRKVYWTMQGEPRRKGGR